MEANTKYYKVDKFYLNVVVNIILLRNLLSNEVL